MINNMESEERMKHINRKHINHMKQKYIKYLKCKKHIKYFIIVIIVIICLCTGTLFLLSGTCHEPDKRPTENNGLRTENNPSQPESDMWQINTWQMNTLQIGHYLRSKNEMLQCRYYNEKEFFRSVENSGTVDDSTATAIMDTKMDASPKNGNSMIYGGIVPHHLLAGDMIASFFQTIAVEKYDVVVVLAPNHKGIGKKSIHTGAWSWQTPFGILEADSDIVNSLVDSKLAGTNFELLEEDHSVSALVPYIKYYLPDSKIVPILLHGNLGMYETQRLGQYIYGQLENRHKKGIIIASFDFSHYLTLEEANKMDEISIKAIENRDYDMIQLFDNDYMDSPPSVITLLSAMDAAGAKYMKILGHSNSDLIIDAITGTKGPGSSETTSYFTAIFYR